MDAQRCARRTGVEREGSAVKNTGDQNRTTPLPTLDYSRGEFWVPCLLQREDETTAQFRERVAMTERAVEEACKSP